MTVDTGALEQAVATWSEEARTDATAEGRRVPTAPIERVTVDTGALEQAMRTWAGQQGATGDAEVHRGQLDEQPFAPRPARGTPAAEPSPMRAPSLGARGLQTGPVPILPPRTARPDQERRRPVGRVLGAIAGLAVAGLAVTHLTTQPGSAETARPAKEGRGARGAAAGPVVDEVTADAPSTPAPRPTSSAARTRSASPSRSATPARSTSAAPSRSSAAPARTASPPTVVRALQSAGSSVTMAAGIYRMDDFSDALLGTDLTGGLVGAGSGATTVMMRPGTSTRTGAVPTKRWDTNQLSLVRISDATRVGGFTLRGTDQGHLYNGLRISRSTGVRVSDVRVTGIPGNDDVPPGETFGINDYRTVGAVYSAVRVDAGGTGAAAFGSNDSKDVTIEDSAFHDSAHANGATFWQTDGVTVRNTASTGNHDAGFNFERVTGDVLLDHVVMRGNGLADLRINTDRGSARYTIVDPVFSGPMLDILMTDTYLGRPNTQRRSDVRVLIGGVDRTAEVVRWVGHR